MGAVREEPLKLIGGLPEGTSWGDIIHQSYVRKKIEMGVQAAEQERVMTHDDVKRQFLPQ